MTPSRPGGPHAGTRHRSSATARPGGPAIEDTAVIPGNTAVRALVGSDRAEVPVATTAGP